MEKWNFPSINRNIVECKVIITIYDRFIISVLIETLWNVKWEDTKLKTDADMVLIETLWNVNTSEYRARKLLKSVL